MTADGRTTRAQKRPARLRSNRGAGRTKFLVPNTEVVATGFELTRNERTRLNWIAESLGMSATDLLRAWIREGRAPGPGEGVDP